ncbi:MAG: hypothetical protein DRI89_14910 [Bacteroidetes bacterium]|nr:MAG: hypothetical protein DRI89_14910 [Bacteroidota bacterium]
MKKLKIILGILVVIGILGGIYGWFFVYNKPHRDYENAKADYSIVAIDCYQKYASLAEGTENIYTGKMLEISGIPSKVETSDSLCVIVFVFNEGMFGDEGIRCSMLPGHHEKAKLLSMNETVNIKGFCSGYNGTDVVLEHCSIVRK